MTITEELAFCLKEVLECSQLLRDARLTGSVNKVNARVGGLAYAENQAREVLLKYETSLLKEKSLA